MAQGRSPAKVEVRCVDLDGKPVAGAEVIVFTTKPIAPGKSDMVESRPFVSDEQGRVATVTAMSHSGGHFWRMVYARVPDKMVGSKISASWSGGKAADPVTVVMQPSREVHGQVRVPEGFDVTTVTVRTLSLNGVVGDNRFAMSFPRSYSLEGLREVLPQRFDAKVDKEGRWSLRDIPVKAMLYLAAEGPGLAQAQWHKIPRFGQPLPEIPALLQIEMHPESSIAGVVRGPTGWPLASALVTIKLLEGGVTTSWKATTGDDGSYRLHGLAMGQHRVKVTTDVGVMRELNIALPRGQQLGDQDLQVEPGVRVAGRVVDSSGKPVEGVSLRALDPAPYGHRIQLGDGATDPQGRFEMLLPTGDAELHLVGLPKGFTYPKQRAVALLDVREGGADLTKVEVEIARVK